MKLSSLENNKSAVILEINLDNQTATYLQGLGFVAGTKVTVINESHGSLILDVRRSRIAINKDIADNILIAAR